MDWLITHLPLIAGVCLGLLGQSLNVGVGLYKRIMDPAVGAIPWSWPRFTITIWLGAAAGMLGMLVHPDALFVVAVGYGGTNAVDSLMQATLRKFSP